jgi:4,5-epoxidase
VLPQPPAAEVTSQRLVGAFTDVSNSAGSSSAAALLAPVCRPTARRLAQLEAQMKQPRNSLRLAPDQGEYAALAPAAGPTGLTLACGLLANGVAARVVDKAVEPAGTSRALGLQPRGIEVVERLGALNNLPERALQVEQIVVHINGKHAASVRVGQRTALVTRPGLVSSQALVAAELRRRVTELGGQIVWGREVAAAEQDSDGVTVSLADGGQSRVSWLVGCDGAHSRVRQLAGVGFPGVPLAERFLLVDVHADLPLSRRSI